MKICILGLDGATPALAFQDERLVNLRRLMELGTYGSLQGVIPPGPLPGWMCLAASQDPGSLGIYGSHNRRDYSYAPPSPATPAAIPGPALWDQVAAAEKKSVLLGVPPNSPPRPIKGVSIGCFLADLSGAELTCPASVYGDIRRLVGEYSVDVDILRGSKDELRQQIFEVARKQWEVARWLLRQADWEYFHFVDIGLQRMQRAFWEYFDQQHPRFRSGNPYQDVIPDYYLWLDEQIGSALELLDAETVLLVASAYGMERLDGGFAINQWLIEEGLLVLKEPPGPGITPFHQLNVDWSRTRAWSEEGACALIYINVRSREPQGVIPPEEYETFRDQIKEKLASLRDHSNRPLQTLFVKPQEIYREVRNVAPDMIVQLGEGCWRPITSVGHHDLFLEVASEASAPGGPGLFVLTAPNCPLTGEYQGGRLLDIAPTLLDLAGYEIPGSMQGRSLVAAMEKKGGASPDNDQIIMDRLAGLGYV